MTIGEFIRMDNDGCYTIATIVDPYNVLLKYYETNGDLYGERILGIFILKEFSPLTELMEALL